MKDAFQDLNRVRQIAVIATRYGFADVLQRSGLGRFLGRPETVPQSREAQSASVARRLRLMLNELGPTFIKLGQILSTRPDLIPAAFIEELSTLQDSVPPVPLEQVLAQIRSCLGKDPSELFRSIDPAPLATASIAQVHGALTHDGQEVVVKVQRPGIVDQIEADLSVLHYLATALEAVVEEAAIWAPSGIVEEFDRAIHEELDFLNEASNVRAFAKSHEGRSYVRIPRVYDELSSHSVLTLERLRGTNISQLDLTSHDRQKLALAIVEGAFNQLFQDGLFHGDPHPGNIFVLENDVLGLIDFGLVGRLTKPMQDTLVMLVMAVALKDSDSVARLIYRLGAPDAPANLIDFRNDIDAILNQYVPARLGEISAKYLLRDLLDLAVKYRIRIPKEYAILARASIATEGLLRRLYPELNVGEVALPYAKKLLAGRYDPNQLQGGVLKTLLRLQGFANDLPMQLSQILIDLESGKFSVMVKAEQLREMNAHLRSLAGIGFLGMCTCGFIIGAFISFATRPWVVHGVPVMGLFGVVIASALFGGALTWIWFVGAARKLSLRRALRRRSKRAAGPLSRS